MVAFFRLCLNKHPYHHFSAPYPLLFQKKCLSLQCVRIEGSAEVRPLNVSTTAQAKAAGTEKSSLAVFIFHNVAKGTFYLAYC